MSKKECHSCNSCGTQSCRNASKQYPNFCPTGLWTKKEIDEVTDLIKNDKKISDLYLKAAEIEGTTYGKLSRVEETIEIIKRCKFKYVGIATCFGLINETKIFCDILKKNDINFYVVCCKIGYTDKNAIGIPNEHKVNKGKEHETMCNPILQAKTLAKVKTDFNIVIGLCVGHDAIFNMYSKVPTTTLIVKDRVLCHNPVGALYTANTIYSRFK
ncbi:MAG: DUF1847 domain-containing protein [Rickettsiales bacterium]|jgi:uncharacterized metal-binding protein|nr:DUF1847 domain-containing protein [Rickettsiales bacterium]